MRICSLVIVLVIAVFFISLSVDAASPVLVKGDDSAISKVYAEFYRGCKEGNADKVRGLMSSERRKEFDQAPKEIKELFFEMMKALPKEIYINKPVVKGPKATLTWTGKTVTKDKMGTTTEEHKNTVTMHLEEGKWKVGVEEMSSKMITK